MNRFDLACIGRAAVDLYGEQVGCGLEEVSSFARYLGGSPANTAVGAARLGLTVAMISRVGDEQNGQFVRATLAREGVDVSQVGIDPERLTALVFLAIRGDGDFPHVFYRDRCADMGLAERDIDAGFIARCGALLVSGTHLSQPGPRAACLRALQAARAAKARVVLDIDYRPVLWGLVRPGEGSERAAATGAATASVAEVLPQCDLVVGTRKNSAWQAAREISSRRSWPCAGRPRRCWWSSAAPRAASRTRPRFLGRREGPRRSGLPRGALQFAGRRRCVHGRLPQRMVAWREPGKVLPGGQCLRGDRGLAPRLRTGHAHGRRARALPRARQLFAAPA
jgi:sugar/nucleoside kinase (ribokinase family)